MTLNELLRVFWQRKLLVIAVTLAVVIPAYVATTIVPRQYESTATLTLAPVGPSNLLLFTVFDQVVPSYAEVATSRSTLLRAEEAMGRPLADISVDTFKGTGIIKIRARSTDRRLAELSASAVSRAFLDRVDTGGVGVKSLRLTEVNPPELPTSPVFPRTKLTLFVATLLGLGLGLAAALLREILTTKIETADDLAKVTGAPVFAEIPSETAILKMHSGEDLATDPRLRMVAEALRDLRTNLLFTDDTIRSLVVTSPDGSHGKTTIAFGLATTMARSGTRTLLIDADLRRGRIAKLLSLPDSPGLIDVLYDEIPLEKALRTTPDGLDVLVGGTRSADPGELLTGAFPGLLDRLEREYDSIVIDSTPLIPISDARIVARYADATLLVARAGAAPRRHVRTAVERLDLISIKLTAAVLNHSGEVSSSSYYVRPSDEEEAAKGLRTRRLEKRGAARR
jgi:succinoglycan biosynthesis transport protein ExoP